MDTSLNSSDARAQVMLDCVTGISNIIYECVTFSKRSFQSSNELLKEKFSLEILTNYRYKL